MIYKDRTSSSCGLCTTYMGQSFRIIPKFRTPLIYCSTISNCNSSGLTFPLVTSLMKLYFFQFSFLSKVVNYSNEQAIFCHLLLNV